MKPLSKPAAPRKLRLGTTLVVPFVLQILVAVGLVGYLSFKNGQTAVNTVTSKLRSELTTRIQEKLQSYTETPRALNRLNATAVLNDEINMDRFEGESAFWLQMQLHPLMSYIFCGSEAGSFMAVGKPDPTADLVVEISGKTTNFQIQDYHPTIDGKRGQLRKVLPGKYDPRIRPWYTAAKAAGKEAWSDIYLNFENMKPEVTASIPVYNKSTGRLIGVCATSLLLPAELSDFLRTLKIGKTGTAFIIERSGQLVATSSQEPMTSGTGKNTERLFAADSNNTAIRDTARHLKSRFADFKEIRELQQIDFWLKGERQLVQVAPFRDLNLDWLIVLAIPESDFMAEINAQTHITMLTCLAALIVAIVIGVLTARGITQPIGRMTAASKAMSQGALTQHVQTSRLVELGKLGNAFNSMAGQLKESFETLEEKVEARTAELANANDEITSLNDRLKAENLHLGAELDVARQIQTMILPRPEELEIDGLDIAGYMEPADEVGGDYYDVLQSDGHVLIGIGDVTGHGLESGLMMLMTQTAVRTLQESHQTDPVRFLDVLNRTIYGNAARINADKSLTLSLLDYSKGAVRISGQHEEVLVVRAGGSVERVDTMNLGFPLGLEEDISSFVAEHRVALQPGDGVVLYTDGITEARDMERKLYGLERLCAVIGHSWAGSADEIRHAVIADVRAFIGEQRVFDDMTLLVLKQKPERNGQKGEFNERI